MDYHAALKDYASFEFTDGPWTREVFRRGQGPAVIVIHEMPGLHPLVVRFADHVAAAVRRKDGNGYIETDRAFHLALVSRAGNSLLTKMIMELRDGMRLYGMDSPAGRQRQVASVKEHYRLIDLAVAGDVATISKLIAEHIRSWEPVFTAALEDRLKAASVRARGR